MLRWLAFLLALSGAVSAAPVSLSWDPVEDSRLTGYELGWGGAPGAYSQYQPTVGTASTLDLPAPGPWYIVVRSLGEAAGLPIQSAWSNEVVWALDDGPTQPLAQQGLWAVYEREGTIMAAFDNYAGATVGTAESITCAVPTGITDGYLMLAHVIARGGTVTGVPSGWDLVVSAVNFDANGSNLYVYEKIAASESGSYTWDFSTSIRAACAISSFSGVDTADPIDSYSSTAYVTNDTTVRSASVTTSSSDQLVVNLAVLSQSTQLTFTAPTDFSEHFEYGGNRCWSEVSSRTYASAGSTGDIDATMSAASIYKHGIAIALNNAAASGLAIPVAQYHYLNH